MEQAYMGQGTSVDKGENARLNSIVGAIAIADLVKTTLGPKGLDKILQKVDPTDQSISVTNDGATILRSIPIDNAAAKVLVDIAKVQDDTIGDGTTSVAVLCGELLREAESLMDGASSSNSGSASSNINAGGGVSRIHPQTLCSGWRLAKKVAIYALEQHSKLLQKQFVESSAVADGNISKQEQLRSILINIAKTTLSSKLVSYEKDRFAILAVDAVLRLKECNYDLHHIQIMKKAGGSLRDSYLEEGFLLDKSIGVGQPKRIENAKIVLANTSMDTDKIKIYGSRVRVDSLNKVADIEQAEKDKMKSKVEKILAHGANVFINRQLIYNLPESIFASHNVMAIEHADFDGIERLAAVTGGQVISTFDHPELVTLGQCDLIEEIMIGEDKVIRFGGCKAGDACTIVLRGASTHVLDEAERSVHDALCILATVMKDHNKTRTTINEKENEDSTNKDGDLFTPPKIICGGGCTEIIMSQAIDRVAETIPGKKALAMTCFAKALRSLPAIVADNGGYDSSELITQLRAAHSQHLQQLQAKGNANDVGTTVTDGFYGLDMYNGRIGNMKQLGVLESYQSKWHVINSASEAAEMILRVDDIIKSAPRQREERY